MPTMIDIQVMAALAIVIGTWMIFNIVRGLLR
jgi:hypothetical protein